MQSVNKSRSKVVFLGKKSMEIKELGKLLSRESNCITYIRKQRESQEITCKKCGSTHHYWLASKTQWQCKWYRFRATLCSGTVMENSLLPLSCWIYAVHLVSNTNKGISALELQQQLGLKRYEPAWMMMHKYG